MTLLANSLTGTSLISSSSYAPKKDDLTCGAKTADISIIHVEQHHRHNFSFQLFSLVSQLCSYSELFVCWRPTQMRTLDMGPSGDLWGRVKAGDFTSQFVATAVILVSGPSFALRREGPYAQGFPWSQILLHAVGQAIYNLYFHPLSKYPGPRLAAISNTTGTWSQSQSSSEIPCIAWKPELERSFLPLGVPQSIGTQVAVKQGSLEF